MRPPVKPAALQQEHAVLADLLVVVFGTGGILLMAGYAVLCDRI